MENFSSLIPTDNLYKFLSISGILIFGFCFFYPDYRTYQIVQRQITLSIEGEILDVRIKAVGEKISTYTKKINQISDESSGSLNLISKISKMNISKMSESEIKKYKSQLLSSKKVLNAKSLEMDKTVKLLQSVTPNSDSLRILNLMGSDIDRLDKLSRVATIGQITGVLMTIIGFSCWFFFIQLPQDKLLYSQIDDIKKSKNKAISES